MNKRRRYKAHRRRAARKICRRVQETMTARSARADSLRASMRFERMFPRAHRAMLNRGGGPHGSDWP